MTPTLRDLCADAELGLRYLVDGEGFASRPLAGAHAIEIPEPARWLAPGWLLLTTGLRLRNSAEAQRRLARHCEENGLAAIAFGVGTVFASPPRALVEECKRLRYPLLLIPHETPFRAVVSFVERALISADHVALRRRAGIHEALTEALLEPEPKTRMIERLAETLDGGVALIPTAGSVLRAGPSEVPWEAIAGHLADRSVFKDPFAQPGWVVYAETVGSTSAPSGWLVVAFEERSRGVGIGTIRPVLRSAARLLSLLALSTRALRLSEQAAHADLVDALTLGTGAEPSAESLAEHGFAPKGPARVALISPQEGVEPSEGRLVPLAGDIERLADEHRVACLASGRHGRLAVIFDGEPEQLLHWVQVLLGKGTATIGVGRSFTECCDAKISRRDAEVTLAYLADHTDGARILTYEDLGLSEWLTTSADLDLASVKAEAVLGPLRSRPELLLTAQAFLRHDGKMEVTARELHVHPNSLRHRLQRVLERTGCDLRTTAGAVEMQLALLLNAPTETPTV